MAQENNEQAQPEGAEQSISQPELPVNLAAVQATKRGANPKPKKAEPAETEAAGEPAAQSAREVAPQLPPADPATATEELAKLAEASTKGRLSPAEEERATSHMRVCIAHDAEGMNAALAAMGKLPWILGVRAIEQEWAALPEATRAALLVRLSEERWGDFIRLRLSLARSLTRIDAPVGVQLAAAVCRSVWMEEKGMLTPTDSKLIGNVFIGRGKPWVLQIPLEGLAEEDARAIVSCVAFSAFHVNNPPITQLSVLRYAGARLGQLHESLLGMIAKSVSRWSGKWKASLQSEVPELPEPIAAAAAEATQDAPRESQAEAEEKLPPELEEKLKAAIESGEREVIDAVTAEVNDWREAHRVAEEDRSQRGRRGQRGKRERGNERSDRGGERANEREGNREQPRESERDRGRGRKERPAYVSREDEAAAKNSGGSFNLVQSLRQIENHVQQLRNELVATQTKLRKAETGGARRPSSTGGLQNLSAEELARVVLQLEGRNAELQSRVEDLLADSEARALATAADADITVQYRTLLKLKLQESYVDYLALETGTPDVVVKQHYRALIRNVFAVLRDEHVALDGDLPPPPPAPMPPFPPAPEVDDIEEDDEELDQIDLTPPEMPAEEEIIEDVEDAEDAVDDEDDLEDEDDSADDDEESSNDDEEPEAEPEDAEGDAGKK